MKKAILPGLALYTLSSGLGLFHGADPSGLLLSAWVTGYVVLALAVSYTSFFSTERFSFFPFIVLGVILLNFFIQITGGVQSWFWPAYFLVAAGVAVFFPLRQTYGTTALILGIEASNLFVSGQWNPEKIPLYAGFAFSLLGVSIAIAHMLDRTRTEAEQVKDKHERLIEHADAIDPLAENDTVEALTEENQLALNVKAARDLENAFSGLIDMIYGFVPAHAYALFLKERVGDGESFVLRARRSETDGHLLLPVGAVLRPEKDNGIINGCSLYMQPQCLSSIEQSTVTLGYYTRNMPIRSILAIPIIQNGNNIGVLVVDSLEQGAFSLETQDLLSRFAPFFIQIIEKIRVSQELNMRANTFAAMHKMSAVLNSTLELQDMLSRLAREINVLVPNDFCVFVQYDEKSRTTGVVHESGEVSFARADHALLGRITSAVKSLSGTSSEQENDGRIPVQEGTLINQMLNQWEQRQGSPYHFFDLRDRKVMGLLDTTTGLTRQLRSLSCWPLATGEKFIGAFFLGSLQAHAFSEFQRNFLDTLSNQIALVVDNAILHQQISNLARTDGLTGLLNHRTFMEKLSEEYKRIDREERPFSILLMDIDKFKSVNDTYGHPVGDLAIKAVAKVLKNTVRATDFVARYGGEEFAVGMVDTTSKGAEQMAERVRNIMEKTVAAKVGAKDLMITLSIGVSCYPEDTRNTAELVTLADNALYQAKRSGRNRVCLVKQIDQAETAAPAPGAKQR